MHNNEQCEKFCTIKLTFFGSSTLKVFEIGLKGRDKFGLVKMANREWLVDRQNKYFICFRWTEDILNGKGGTKLQLFEL